MELDLYLLFVLCTGVSWCDLYLYSVRKHDAYKILCKTERGNWESYISDDGPKIRLKYINYLLLISVMS